MSFICQIRLDNKIARLERLQMINIEHNLYKRVETTKDCLHACYIWQIEKHIQAFFNASIHYLYILY